MCNTYSRDARSYGNTPNVRVHKLTILGIFVSPAVALRNSSKQSNIWCLLVNWIALSKTTSILKVTAGYNVFSIAAFVKTSHWVIRIWRLLRPLVRNISSVVVVWSHALVYIFWLRVISLFRIHSEFMLYVITSHCILDCSLIHPHYKLVHLILTPNEDHRQNRSDFALLAMVLMDGHECIIIRAVIVSDFFRIDDVDKIKRI